MPTIRELAYFHYHNRVLQRPLFGFKSSSEWSALSPEEGERRFQALKREGAVLCPAFLKSDEISELRSILDEIVDGRRRDGVQYSFSEKSQNHNVLQPLLTKAVVRAALSPDLRRMADNYFGRPAQITECDMRRVPPMSMDAPVVDSEKFRKGQSSSHWHYDTRGKLLKIQIYLTDVPEPDGQNFAYIRGTLKHYVAPDYAKSRISDEWVEKNIDPSRIVEVWGSAGDALFFDPNCIHRLRRRPTTARDSLTFYFTPGQVKVNPQYVDREIYESLTEDECAYLNVVGPREALVELERKAS